MPRLPEHDPRASSDCQVRILGATWGYRPPLPGSGDRFPAKAASYIEQHIDLDLRGLTSARTKPVADGVTAARAAADTPARLDRPAAAAAATLIGSSRKAPPNGQSDVLVYE